MNLKKLISGAAVSTLALAGFVSASSFNDVAGHWVETAGTLDAAVSAGVIDGTKPSFRPNETINRAELTKIVSVYDNGGDEPTANDYVSDAGFSDVNSGAWYNDVINYAAGEGIVSGYTDGTFKPANAINRAEAVKVITLALEVPSVDVTLPFTDVATSDWFFPFVKNAYGNCVVNGRTASKFEPASFITRAEAVKVFVNSINPGCSTTPATATAAPTATPDGQTATPTPAVTTDATVDVVLSSMSPAGQSIPRNAYQVPFLAIDITASNDEDLLLTGLSLQHSGLGNADHIKSVQAFEGVIPRGNDKNFSGEDDVAVLNLGSDPIVVPAGTTKTVYIRADIEAINETAGEHKLALLNANSITLIGKDTGAVVPTTGTFPIVGSTMTVADISVGSVSIEYDTIDDRVVEAGSTDVELADIRLSETTGTEDVYARALTLEVRGDLDDGDIENMYVVVDGARVSNIVASSSNDYVTFDLTSVIAEGVLIQDGSNESFSVRGDLTGAIDSFSDASATSADVYLAVDSTNDIVLTGAKYGFGVNRTIASAEASQVSSATDAYTANTGIVVTGGDITFSLESEATDVAENTDDVIFGTLTIENLAEAIEIDGDTFDFYLTSNRLNGAKQLENIRLVSKLNGSTVLGSVDVTTTADIAINAQVRLEDLADDLYVGAGQTVEYYVVADTKDNLDAGSEGTTYRFTLAGDASNTEGLDTITVTGQTSDETTGFDIKPSGTLSTKIYTLQEAGVTVTMKTLQSDTYVASTDGAVVWNGTVRADNVKDLSVDRMAFSYAGTATTSDLNNFGLQALVDGVWMNVDTGVSVNSPFTFSDLDELAAGTLLIEAGEEVEIRVIADVADTVVNNNTIIVTLDSVEFQEVEADGSLGDSSTTTLVAPAYTAVAFTLVDNGSLTITLDSADTPNNELLIAGTDTNTVAVYKVKADDESVAVDDLTINVTDTTVAAGLTGSSTVAALTATTSVTTAGVASTEDTATIVFGDTSNLIAGDTLTISGLMINGAAVADVVTTFTAGDLDAKLDQIVTDLTASALTAVRSGRTISITEATASTLTGTPSLTGTSAGQFTTTPVQSIAAVAEVSTVTVGGSYVMGDIISVTTATGTVANAGTEADLATALAALVTALNADALVASAVELNGVITITAVADTDNTLPDASAVVTPAANAVTTAGARAATLPADAKDSVESVSLYHGTTLLDTVTLDSNGDAKFEDLNWVVDAGETEALIVKVNLNNIGTNSSDTAQSGHTFTTSMTVVEVKGQESGDVLTVANPTAPTAYFIVANNKLQVAKSAQSTTLAGTTADLLKFKIFDASTDGDNAEVTALTFDISATGTAVAPTAGADYTVSGGSQVPTCAMAGTVLTCTYAIAEEISTTGTTFVLKATANVTPGTDSSITTKLVVNSATPTITEGVTWTDGGDASTSTANGASIQWVDFGEADETTSYILNTVSN